MSWSVCVNGNPLPPEESKIVQEAVERELRNRLESKRGGLLTNAYGLWRLALFQSVVDLAGGPEPDSILWDMAIDAVEPADAPLIVIARMSASYELQVAESIYQARPWWWRDRAELESYEDCPGFESAACPKCRCLIWKPGDGSVAAAVDRHQCSAAVLLRNAKTEGET